MNGRVLDKTWSHEVKGSYGFVQLSVLAGGLRFDFQLVAFACLCVVIVSRPCLFSFPVSYTATPFEHHHDKPENREIANTP